LPALPVVGEILYHLKILFSTGDIDHKSVDSIVKVAVPSKIISSEEIVKFGSIISIFLSFLQDEKIIKKIVIF
jgi:hypothetical protein